MSTDDNKAAVRQVYEAISGHNLDGYIQGLAANYVDHSLPPGLPPGIESSRMLMAGVFAAFPDLVITIEDMIAEGNSVAGRVTLRGTHQGDFQGIPPTGKQVAFTSIEVFRVGDGKITERWGEVDTLGMLQQLGAIPMPGAPAH